MDDDRPGGEENVTGHHPFSKLREELIARKFEPVWQEYVDHVSKYGKAYREIALYFFLKGRESAMPQFPVEESDEELELP